MFYTLLAVTQAVMLGIGAWTLSEVIHQGKEIVKIEEHLDIAITGDVDIHSRTMAIGNHE